MQPSLVQRLRDSVTQCRALDRSQLLEEAAAELERLGGKVVLWRAVASLNAQEVASAGSVTERPLGDPEIAVEILKLRVAELEQAIRRIADQDATLSVCDGAVTVTMDATLTAEERDAVRFSVTASLPETEKLGGVAAELCRMHAATLRGLLERTK